ncbi:MAG: sulfurtransferase complex subunit TusD [Halioglobus sp.]
MIYTILVMSSPASGHCSRSAAEFALRVLARGHRIYRVFFLDAGTTNGSVSNVYPQDETDPATAWLNLAEEHAVDLVICITSALRYGMLDDTESRRHERPGATVNRAFTLSGLGQLVDACAMSDRLVTFGG